MAAISNQNLQEQISKLYTKVEVMGGEVTNTNKIMGQHIVDAKNLSEKVDKLNTNFEVFISEFKNSNNQSEQSKNALSDLTKEVQSQKNEIDGFKKVLGFVKWAVGSIGFAEIVAVLIWLSENKK